MAPKVFLITGTSTGFGSDLVSICLSNNHHVIATARSSSKLSFKEATDSNLLKVDLDVTDSASIDAAFAAGIKKFGRIDVVVNNAGYGLCGSFETLSDKQIRTQFEVNFFGLLEVTRKALRFMREQKPPGGVIQQVTSIGGQIGVPLFSAYSASKFAVEGATEAISRELKPEWGIKLTCIEPGGFRTDWAGRSMSFGDVDVPGYNLKDAPNAMEKRHGSQPGDPKKGAQAFFDLAMMKDPPLRCLVGTDAYKNMNMKLKTLGEGVEKYKDLTNSTDVDGYKSPS